MAAIICRNVSFGYSEQEPILKNCSFEVEKGEFVAIIGPNGGGKTTLFKLLMGVFKPWEGDISILGSDPRKEREAIGYVPQNLRFDRQFPITVRELVLGGRISSLSWFGRYSKEDNERVFVALEKVGLEDFAKKPFGTLSGGQAQRALIARALVQEPKVLLLDEPTANVDIEAEADIYELLDELKGHLTILMVTHDIRAIIHKVKKVLCVQCHVAVMDPQKLCEHFALGLYHYPLFHIPESHFEMETFAKTRFPV